MALINVLSSVCASLLLLRGVSPQGIYSRAGDDTTLPCDRIQHHGPNCSDVNWLLYKRLGTAPIYRVTNGKVMDRSSRLNSDCCLSLQNITEKDSGVFHYNFRGQTDPHARVYLSVLTVSIAPADSSQKPDEMTLNCSLGTYNTDCRSVSFRWLDQNNMSLFEETKNCVSFLTVERQSELDRTFTCQCLRSSDVKVSVEYRLRGNKNTDQPTDPDSDEDENENENTYMYIIVGAVVSLLILLAVAAVVLFKIKSKRSAPQEAFPDDPLTHQPTDPVTDPESGVTYATINHQTARARKQVEVEDAVTYSAVSIKTTADSSNSAIYSTVNKSKANSSGRTSA